MKHVLTKQGNQMKQVKQCESCKEYPAWNKVPKFWSCGICGALRVRRQYKTKIQKDIEKLLNAM